MISLTKELAIDIEFALPRESSLDLADLVVSNGFVLLYW